MTPSSSVSDVDVNALLNHRRCRCFRAAALFEEDTHALKKIGKEGIAFVTSSLSSRASFPVVASTIVRMCAFTLKQRASDDPFHFPETVTQCEAKTSLHPGRISRENARYSTSNALSSRDAQRDGTFGETRFLFFERERTLYYSRAHGEAKRFRFLLGVLVSPRTSGGKVCMLVLFHRTTLPGGQRRRRRGRRDIVLLQKMRRD